MVPTFRKLTEKVGRQTKHMHKFNITTIISDMKELKEYIRENLRDFP